MKSLSVLLLAVSLSITQAAAHAFLDHAEPKVGAIVSPSPSILKIWFTEDLEPAFSHIHVMDSSGKVVSQADAYVDAADPTLLLLSLPKLPPGKYTVMWQVVAKDTHHTQGTFSFDIRPPA